MAQTAIDKIPPGPKLDALTAEKVFGWRNVHQHDCCLVGKKGDKLGHWRSAKVPNFSTNPLDSYSIEQRMKQLARSEKYLRELSELTSAKNVPLNGRHLINVAEQRSKLWDNVVGSFL
jgi:hypothetical protein